MKNILVIALALVPGLSFASVEVFNNANHNLGHFDQVKCANGLECEQISGKAEFRINGLSEQSAVSQDLTVDDCGKTFTSDYVGPEMYNLPALSSTIFGCRFTFIVGITVTAGTTGSQQLEVNPANADRILLLANAAGDKITADALGESVVLEAIKPGWAPVGKEQGTWTDSN